MYKLTQEQIVDLAVKNYNEAVNLYEVKGHQLGGGYQLQGLYTINTQAQQVMMAGPRFIDDMLENLGFENSTNDTFNINPKTGRIASDQGATEASKAIASREDIASLEVIFGAIYNQYSGKPVQDNLDSLKNNPTRWEQFKDLLNQLVKFISKGKAGYSFSAKQNKNRFNVSKKSVFDHAANKLQGDGKSK